LAEPSADETAVRRAAEELVAAFGAHDTAGYFARFAPEATYVFHTTPDRLPDRASYERLWEQWEREDGFRVHGCSSSAADVRLHGGVGIFVHDVATDLELGGARSIVRERETIVFERRGAGWLAVHEHLSPRPEPEDAG
jgi:ketosteroid isomerase-like protein